MRNTGMPSRAASSSTSSTRARAAQLDLVALVIEGVLFADHRCVALGMKVDRTGRSSRLPILAVLDGVKALPAAVK
jgi:hypothetical protein